MTIDTKALRELALLDVIEMKTPFPDEITLKTRAKNLLALRHAERGSDLARYQHGVIALLQELIDAPEPEPFGYFKAEPFGWTDCSETDEGAIALYAAPPTKNQSEQHLEMVNAPAPSVPDWLETTRFLTDVTTAAGLLEYGKRDKGLARRIGDFAYKYRMLAAAPAAPEPPALSDERIREIWIEHGLDDDDVEGFARAIEREILGGGHD